MAHEGMWQKLISLDRQKTSQRAKCRYRTATECYVVTLLNREFTVNLSDRQIFAVRASSQPQPAEFLEQLCILAYLINAQDLPLANKLVRPISLPGGQFFFRSVHSLPVDKLEKSFGLSPERLYHAAEQLGAKRCEFGDASIELNILPRLPLVIVIWRADDQFPARASILFDRTAAAHLPLDALNAAANLAVGALTKACE